MYEIKPFDIKDLNFTFDLSKASYKIDTLQSRIIETYTRIDRAFREAVYTNYTQEFLQMIKDRAIAREPFHLSIKGTTRGGKSESMMSVCILHQAYYNRKWSADFICSNRLVFLEKIRDIKQANPEALKNSIFQLDEEKNVFGIGSTAKKTKFSDLQNIIAKANISTISICPSKFSNEDATYGLSILGKCEVTKTCRFMLYNLIEGGQRGEIALGMVYLPIISALAPADYTKEIIDVYKLEKDKWIDKEIAGEGDILYKIKLEKAFYFSKDETYTNLKMKERLVYISMVLGSEWTRGETEEINTLASMILKGVLKPVIVP